CIADSQKKYEYTIEPSSHHVTATISVLCDVWDHASVLLEESPLTDADRCTAYSRLSTYSLMYTDTAPLVLYNDYLSPRSSCLGPSPNRRLPSYRLPDAQRASLCQPPRYH